MPLEPLSTSPFQTGRTKQAAQVPVFKGPTKSLLFGSSSADAAIILPAWAQSVPMPTITAASINEAYQKQNAAIQLKIIAAEEEALKKSTDYQAALAGVLKDLGDQKTELDLVKSAKGERSVEYKDALRSAIYGLPYDNVNRQAWERTYRAVRENAPEVRRAQFNGQQQLATLMVKNSFNLWMEERRADGLLPNEVRSRIRNYKWLSFSGWYDGLFNRPQYKRMVVALSGPIAIKEKQQWVQDQLNTKGETEILLKILSDKATLDKQAKLFTTFTQKMAYTASRYLVLPIVRMALRWKLKNIEDYQPLLGKVPFLPTHIFKKDLDQAKREYNGAHGADPIESDNYKPIASGSIGQVFSIKTKSGRTKVVKVARPDATASFFEAFRPYSFYKQVLRTGTAPAQKQRALQEVENNTKFLTEEADFRQEKTNASTMDQEATRLGINHNGPDHCLRVLVPDFVSSTGKALYSDHFGDSDLVDMSADKINTLKSKAVPDVIKTIVFARKCKPGDIHDANFRGENATGTLGWLDHGRQANLNPEVHDKLLKLMVLYYGACSSDANTAVGNAQYVSALKDLVGTKPDSSWNQVLTNNDLTDHSAPAYTTAREQLVNLTRSLFTNTGSLLQVQKDKNLRDSGGASDRPGDSMHGYNNTLLGVWANYELMTTKLQNGVGDLPRLCTKPMSQKDIENYYTKAVGFVRPYFNSAGDEKAVIAQLKAMTRKDFTLAIRDDDGQIPYTVTKAHDDFRDVLDARPWSYRGPEPYYRDDAEKDAKFRRAMDAVLSTASEKRLNLLKAYMRPIQTRKVVDGVTEDFIRESGITFDPLSVRVFKNNIERALNDDIRG